MDFCDRAVWPKRSFFADKARAISTCGYNQSIENVVGDDTGLEKGKVRGSPRGSMASGCRQGLQDQTQIPC